MKKFASLIFLLFLFAATANAQTATKVYGLKVIDINNVVYINLTTSVAASAQIVMDDGENAPLSAANTGSLRYNNLTHALEASVNGSAYLGITTGNWTFTGNNADLNAAGTMGIGLTTATAINVGNTSADTTIIGGNIFLNVGSAHSLIFQTNSVNGIVYAEASLALYSATDGHESLGTSGQRWATLDVFNITGGSPSASPDTSASNVTWTGQPGSVASATGGGTGAAVSIVGGIGGNGVASLNPGNGGAGQVLGGPCGTGGSGNCNGGAAVIDGGLSQGTGTSLVLVGTNHTKQITIGSSGISAVMAINSGTAAMNLTAGAASSWSATSAANTTALSLQPNVADGATSVAVDIDNQTTLSTSGALLFRLRNNSATVQFSVDKGGLGIFNSNVESANGVGVFYGASIDRLTTAAVGVGNTNANVVNIGRSGQSLGFYGVTAVTRQTSTGNTATSAAGSTTNVFTNTTFTGGTGATAYTVGDIVLALKNYGLLVN